MSIRRKSQSYTIEMQTETRFKNEESTAQDVTERKCNGDLAKEGKCLSHLSRSNWI